MGKGKKGKKKGKMVVSQASEPVVDEEVDVHPFFGKNSDFFNMKTKPLEEGAEPEEGNPMNFDMNDAQWNFMFKNYPEYAAAPWDMMTWLFGSAKSMEDLENDAYGPVSHGQDEDLDGELTKEKYNKGFGPKS